MLELLQKRQLFTSLVPRLIDKAIALGYAVTINEVIRDPRVAQWNAANGIGISNSLHLVGLAVDLNLFDDSDDPNPDRDHYIKDGTGHTELGAYWKTLHADCRWGGDFVKRDFNHYSWFYQGRA